MNYLFPHFFCKFLKPFQYTKREFVIVLSNFFFKAMHMKGDWWIHRKNFWALCSSLFHWSTWLQRVSKIHAAMHFAPHKPLQITEELINENLLEALWILLFKNLNFHPLSLFKKFSRQGGRESNCILKVVCIIITVSRQ